MSSKGRPYKTVVVDGWEVLVGRGDAENDQLTFRVASGRDLWLHIGGGTPGSHVVVRVPEGVDDVPAPIIERAAELAAWHSKARNAGKVEVHVCRVADVSKPRGVPAGKVQIANWWRVRVYPRGTDPAVG